jgi:hypothetical protein
MSRRRPPMRAGQRVTAPNGTEVVLPKDWVDLTVADLTALGLGPDQPAGATVSGFIPAAEMPLRWRLRLRLTGLILRARWRTLHRKHGRR